MRLDLRTLLTCGTLLAAIVLAYAELRYSIVDLKTFRTSAEQRIERLQIQVSHLRSWLDEGTTPPIPSRRHK